MTCWPSCYMTSVIELKYLELWHYDVIYLFVHTKANHPYILGILTLLIWQANWKDSSEMVLFSLKKPHKRLLKHLRNSTNFTVIKFFALWKVRYFYGTYSHCFDIYLFQVCSMLRNLKQSKSLNKSIFWLRTLLFPQIVKYIFNMRFLMAKLFFLADTFMNKFQGTVIVIMYLKHFLDILHMHDCIFYRNSNPLK